MSRFRHIAARAAGYLATVSPAPLLAVACAVQLGLGIAVALASTHNHFVWYSGGDATEYWTSSWSLSRGGIPQAFIAYGVPVLWAWVPFVAGTTMLAGLPIITLAQLIVFVPLCAVLIWAIGDLLFGRLFAWWVLWLWIAAPFLLLWGFHGGYAVEFRDYFLAPQWFGLTNMADLPSLLAVLAATWASLRLFESRAAPDAFLAGMCTGLAIGIKPSTGFLIPPIALLLLALRNRRTALVFCGGIAGPVATLAIWKAKGRGTIPLFNTTYQHTHEALGSSGVGAPFHPVVGSFVNTYVRFNWGHFQQILSDLHEVFWSVRLLEFLAIAGLLGALRRSPLKGAFVGLWFVGFCIVKGSSPVTSVTGVNFWRYIEPGLPAFLLLAASVVFLVPRAGRPFRSPHGPRELPGGRRTIEVAFAVLVAVPLIVTAAIPAASSALYARDSALGNDAPISSGLRITSAEASQGAVRLDWRPSGTASTRVYYVVYRSGSPTTCSAPSMGGNECDLTMTSIALTREPSYVDHPGPAPHWYRVGLLANFRDRMDGSDLMLVGPVRGVTSAR